MRIKKQLLWRSIFLSWAKGSFTAINTMSMWSNELWWLPEQKYCNRSITDNTLWGVRCQWFQLKTSENQRSEKHYEWSLLWIFFGHLASIFSFFLVEQWFLNLNMHENHLKADCWAQPQRFWFCCCGGGAGECMFLTSFRWCWGCWPSIRLWDVLA